MTAVVVAAGRGERFGGLKQFADIDGCSVTELSVRGARAVAERVIVVVPSGYDGSGEGADVVVTGGRSRSESVRHALDHVGDAEVIVIHDAVRPLASPELFRSVVAAIESGADAAIPGLEVTDTVKRIERGDPNVVLGTIDRADLVTVQTPQAFRRGALVLAHQNERDATDDAALLEGSDARVVVVTGEVDNVKITSPDDLRRVATMVCPS